MDISQRAGLALNGPAATGIGQCQHRSVATNRPQPANTLIGINARSFTHVDGANVEIARRGLVHGEVPMARSSGRHWNGAHARRSAELPMCHRACARGQRFSARLRVR